jgi:glyoxylase-like metal-dependent hydrolase (beta-lactamase superfamily II)
MKYLIDNASETNICATCGTRYAEAKQAGDDCAICNDDRQYVLESGQQWINYESITANHSIRISERDKELYDLRVVPAFAIGQRAFLVLSGGGNILWDCLPLLDEPTVAFIQAKGGLKGIAISHPHYYSLMAGWAKVFNCPIYLHEADLQWIMDKQDHVELWNGSHKPLWDGMSLIHTPGHFAGSTVLYMPHHGSQGSLLTGDSIFVSRDRKQVGFMYSFPNYVPMAPSYVRLIHERLSPLVFDSMYSAFDHLNIYTGAKEIFDWSVKRYLRQVGTDAG